MLEALDKVKWDMLEASTQTRKVPKHTAWMPDSGYKEIFR